MGTNSKTAHQPYAVAPSATIGAPALPPEQPQTLHSLLFGGWEPVQPAIDGWPEPYDEPEPFPEVPDVADTGPITDPAGAADSDALTPVPDNLPEGVAAGTPLLAGGEDLVDSTATLVSYASPVGGPREVLLATVTEDAEAKIMDALAVSANTMVPVQVEEQINGRLPLDEKEQLHELVATAAKSVNNKLKNGQPIPPHTAGYYDAAKNAVQKVLDDPNATSDEKAMATHYMASLDQISQRMTDTFNTPYDAGGKIPHLGPYTQTGTATVTKYVPAPLEAPELGQLPAALREASRIQASIDPATGMTSWDGKSRSPAHGKEYLIDLGDGWSAIYRPYAANDPATHEYSLRGQLELHAPQGAGNGKELVQRLGRLNLVNRPLSAAEGEWTYLRNNITAQGLNDHKAVAGALAAARALEDLQLQEVFHSRQHEAIGLDEKGLHQLARDFQLEAAAACLPKKVTMVREAVAQATGFSDGKQLTAHPGYDPHPKPSGGWLTWSRFDVTTQPEKLAKAWTGKCLVHKVGGAGNIADILATGVLASTERRAVMGVAPGVGQSESSDKKTGGARSVFLRVRSGKDISGPALVWDNPTALIRRADYYGYNSDHFGVINPADPGHSTKGLTRDPLKIAKFDGATNEIMIGNGIDLLGPEAPSRIICGSAGQRKKLLSQFAERGITHIAGKPVTDIVS